VAAALILVGTLYPLFLDAMNLGKISVGPPYFNVAFLIPMVPLLLLLAVGAHAKWKKGQLDEMKGPLAVLAAVAVVLSLIITLGAYGRFSFMGSVGLAAGLWIILSSLWDPVQRWRRKQTISRGMLGMTIAHIGVALFAIGVTTVETYKIEKDIALKPGESYTLRDYKFTYNGTKQFEGPNYTAIQSEVTITQGDKVISVQHPQKRVYRVQKSPMTEAGLEWTWNRDLFVAMGEDLGAGAWSMRLQYKPMVRFIWLGAIIMALGGLLAITDRRFLRQRAPASDKVGAPGTVKAT
ncbi:MAG TPA: cytochrome c-type biogenesis CcmF C-terminal domain-containing protein, partial [Steroidobacteraceae bacterium]